MSGTIHREEELEVFPTGQHVRVRGVQVHGRAADQATAGQRTALNLAGAATEDLSRGMTLAPAATFQSTRLLDVRLSLLPSAPRALKNRSRVHFHANTMETVAEVSFHGTKQLSPGAEAFGRMKLPISALLLPGDRFIIRQFSPVVTIGGGTVLDSLPIPRAKQLDSFCRYWQAVCRKPSLKPEWHDAAKRGLRYLASSRKQDGRKRSSKRRFPRP